MDKKKNAAYVLGYAAKVIFGVGLSRDFLQVNNFFNLILNKFRFKFYFK